MKKIIFILITLLASCGTVALAQGPVPVSPVGPITTNTQYFEPSTGRFPVYRGGTYQWTWPLQWKDSSYYVTPYYFATHGAGSVAHPLSFGYGFFGQPFSFNGSVPETAKIDTAKIVSHWFINNLSIGTPISHFAYNSSGIPVLDTNHYLKLIDTGSAFSNLIHKALNETITGAKIFTKTISLNSGFESGEGSRSIVRSWLEISKEGSDNGYIEFYRNDGITHDWILEQDTTGINKGRIDLHSGTGGSQILVDVTDHGTLLDGNGNKFIKSNSTSIITASSGIVILPDSTSFATYTGAATEFALKDSLVGGNSLFVLGLKGSNVANGVTMYAAHSPDSLIYRQYDPAIGIMLSWGGAKADGTVGTNTGTDNSPIVQRILNEFPLRTGVFYFNKTGTYKFLSPVDVGQNTMLINSNGILAWQISSGDTIKYRQTQLYFRGNINAFEAPVNVTYRAQGDEYKYLNIVGDGIATNNSAAFIGRKNPDTSPLQTTGLWQFYRCNVSGFGRGWDGTNAGDSWYIDLCTANHGHTGVKTGTVGGTVITRGDFYDMDTVAVAMYGLGDILDDGNQIENVWDGVYVFGNSDQVIGNTITPVTNRGIVLKTASSSTKAIIANNLIHTSGWHGFEADSAVSDYNVHDNTFYHIGETYSNSYGIYLRKTTRGYVHDNILQTPGPDGVAAIHADTCSALTLGVNPNQGWGATYQITGATSPTTVDYNNNINFKSTTTVSTPTASTTATNAENQAGVFTVAGNIVGVADLTAQTSAGTIKSITTDASGTAHTYNIGAYLNPTAISTDIIETQVTYTDRNSNAITVTFYNMDGTSTFTTTGNSFYPRMDIRVKSNTTLTVKTTLTVGGGTVTFDAGATITELR